MVVRFVLTKDKEHFITVPLAVQKLTLNFNRNLDYYRRNVVPQPYSFGKK